MVQSGLDVKNFDPQSFRLVGKGSLSMIYWPFIVSSFTAGVTLFLASFVRYFQAGQDTIAQELVALVGVGFLCLVFTIGVLLYALLKSQHKQASPVFIDETPSQIGIHSNAKILHLLKDRLTADEWKNVIYDLGIDLEWSDGITEARMAREIIQHLDSRKEMVRLGAWLAKNRKDIEL